ncbi:MAG: Gfo/Idh/MocA family oxidoreductase [Caldimonas sp.]
MAVQRIGLIGAGFVSQHHLAAWQRLAGQAIVVAIADPSPENARRRADAFGVPGVYDSAEAMLAGESLDAVDIASPRETHAAMVRLAAAHGIAALCQKPLAPTYDEAAALVAEVAGMRLMVHENWRFRAYYRQIAGWLGAGRIGAVVQARMSLLGSGLLPTAVGERPALVRQPFMATLERALVMEVLIHHLDTLRFLLGDLAVVTAHLGRGSSAMRGEDRAAITLQTGRGAPVQLIANLCVHDEPPTLVDRLVLVGETGTIRLDGAKLTCSGAQPETLEFDLDACYSDSYAAVIAHFAEALRRGGAFETAPEDNLRTLRIVEDVYESATRFASSPPA